MACTKPYVKNAQVVVVKDGTDYTSTADLIGKTVVAEAGSAGETTITENATCLRLISSPRLFRPTA